MNKIDALTKILVTQSSLNTLRTQERHFKTMLRFKARRKQNLIGLGRSTVGKHVLDLSKTLGKVCTWCHVLRISV